MSGDSDYDILYKERETVSLNYIVRFKVNKSIWQVKLIQINFSDKK